GGRTRIINRVKACFVRLGIRGLKMNWPKAANVLSKLRTPDGKPIPPNTLYELKRDLARLLFVSDQIKEIEKTRLARLRTAPKSGPGAMVRILANVLGNGVEEADMVRHVVVFGKMRHQRAVPR